MQNAINVDLKRFKAERHVRAAIALAVRLADGAPVGAASWLRAALQVAPRSDSPAFEHLQLLLPLKVEEAPRDLDESDQDIQEIPVSEALARSFHIADAFLEDRYELWGRDYVTIGLLADDPGINALAVGAGLSTATLRRKWFEFVQSDSARRRPDRWADWWTGAGVPIEGDESPDMWLTPDAPEYSPGLAEILSAAVRGTSPPVTCAAVLLAMTSLGRQSSEPAWAADFMKSQLSTYPGYAAAATKAWPPDSLTSSAKSLGPGTSVVASVALASCLSRAGVLARRTTGKPTLAGRHLLATLITTQAGTPEPESLMFLREAGVDLALLRQRLFDWLRGFGDDDQVWYQVLIGGEEPQRRRAEFDADATTGPDLLNIEPEVQALATLIAARDSVPPMSVGLFGDWGSGKTFFMRRLHKAVDTLSREAREAGAMQRDLPFYKRIVQVEFNAWHYVEGNLWASLVEHLLSNLRVGDETRTSVTEELQRHWIERLGFAEAARTGAEDARREAERGVGQAQRDLEAARREHGARTDELARLSANAIRRDFELSGAARIVREALAPLGLDRVGDAAGELQGALSQARSVLQHGHTVLMPLLRAPDRAARWRRLMFVLVGPPLVALLVGWVVSHQGNDLMAGLSAAATGAAMLLTTGAAWLRKQAGWISEQIGRVEAAQKQYDADLREQLAKTEAAKAHKEQELVLAQQKLVQAEAGVEAAGQRVQQARSDLEAATTTRLLGQFIQDRAASSDYRKHLGVLAVVRQDFEKLSRFIEEENWRLGPASDGDARSPGRLRKIATLQEEEIDAAVRINRIVLYIDDLDRCPPAKVVEVLQAVHLLLAFPLFVVVVGVDARWVSRSLESRYRELLNSSDGAASGTEQMFGAARSRDYLEKIFQIPLWLRPMGRGDTQRMVFGMLHRGERFRAVVPLEPISRLMAVPASQAESQAGTPGALPASAPSSADPSQTRGSGIAAGEHAQQAEQMIVGPYEREVIDSLAPLLGRSPRSIKRFVNVYRLIKAGLVPAELEGFALPDSQGLPPCGAVLLLLAVDTGLPRLSRDLYEALGARIGVQTGVEDLVRWLGNRHRESGDWVRLRDWIQRFNQRLNTTALARLAEWAPRVQRYSFQSPQGDERDETGRRVSLGLRRTSARGRGI